MFSKLNNNKAKNESHILLKGEPDFSNTILIP
jgi:hypothetical protein